MRTLALFLLLTIPIASTVIADEDVEIKVPSTIMQQYLAAQRDYLKAEISAAGTWLNGNEYDLKTFQRLYDEDRIDSTDRRLMQAIGIYMGDLLQEATYNNFRWASYEDDKGKSRALCQREQTPCVFPSTLISRRAEGGADVDFYEIYQRTLEQLQQVPIR
ncbi:DUF3806 domain-containing protein [uncultured Umboniibacter sp.]|uniref:DUF3806 domain-containing protein n=1 Tax=uncultured Umboniibacter sp. TaxID=1798917 RepID=UPI00262A1AE1|nr:DUF3806 domain-containing protein [uncultured Umboniibacter sp.]